MNKLLILILSHMLIGSVSNDAVITIDEGVTVTIDGAFDNNGYIHNEGSLTVSGDYTYSSGDNIDGNGTFMFCDQAKELHSGANLVSFYAIPEDKSITNVMSSLGESASGVITEGGAASQIAAGLWVGSLTEISSTKGYWIIVDSDIDLVQCDVILSNRNTEYSLHSGANLISFPSFGRVGVSAGIPDDVEGSITGIITEGGAATQISPGLWVGSLQEFIGSKGYWVIAIDDFVFSYDLNTLERTFKKPEVSILENYEYIQSSHQAFYFIESIENIQEGDWVLSYNGDELIGSRMWNGDVIDVPVMGNDGNSYSENYLNVGETPQFKILRDDKLIDLEGDINTFENNGLFMISNLSQAVPVPNDFSLDRAYPNPFNPVTTLNFGIPVDSEVYLSIYNLQGREVSSLISGNMEAGYHSVVWNANTFASGVYFVKMIAGEYVSTQKLMLVK